MKDLIHLLWGFAGAIVGFAVGLVGYVALYNALPEQLGRGGAVSLVVVGVLAGGGMVGGGWLALYVVTARDKTRRERERRERKQLSGPSRKHR